LGSLVLGLALADGRLDAAEATALATLDDEAQLDVWGDDPEARARLATIARDVTDAARFMALADA
ncbi:chaperone, ATP12, partial [Ameyamaea chiangmaiensis]|nr:chaperone, ATP12 [Ameyamaea chiangmaiensis]